MAISTECQLLISEFDKISNEVQTLAKAPQRMIDTLNGMIKNAAMSALQTTDQMFNALADQLGISAIEDTLEGLETGLFAMKNCSQSIGNNPLIQAVIGTDIASMDGGGLTDVSQITGKTRAFAQSQAKLNALAALDKGMSAFGLGGQLANTTMRYQQMLKSAGIIDSINLMNDIASCLSSLCSNSSAYQAKIDDHLSKLNLNVDQTVKNLWEKQSASAQSAIEETIARGQALESRITVWAGGLF